MVGMNKIVSPSDVLGFAMTIFFFLLRGVEPGRKMSGKIFLGDIGIPYFIYDKIKRGSRPAFGKSKNGLLTI